MKTYKNFIAALAAVLMLLTLLPSAVFAAEFPKHENYIADEAEILTEDTIREIRDTNKDLSADTQLTIAVCTVNTIGEDDIAVYARDLFEKWKLGEGVLILIAKEDANYYFVPSTGVEDILTNEELANIRDSYFEEDFSNGIYDRAVRKAALKLKNTLVAGLQARAAEEAAAAAENTEETTEKEENKGTTVGGVIVGFFKVLLWLVIIAVLLFVGFFAWAMFNDDAAALFQKYILRRNSGTRSGVPQHTYDDRLYGGRPSNAQRRPGQGQGQPRPNRNGGGYYGSNGGGYPRQQGGYLTDGRNYGGQGYPQQNGYGQPMPQNYNNRGGYPAQGQYPQQPYPNQQGQGSYAGQRPQQNPYGSQTMNPNYGGQGYPQQNGYYNNGQHYPQQNQYTQYGGQQPQQNSNNRPGYGTQQNNYDATVQFNIPRRN